MGEKMLETEAPVLPDVLRPGLKLLVCGTAAGRESARRKAYYTGRGNRFWEVMHCTGLTPCLLAPEEYERLLDFGIGLTDLAKHESGADSEVYGWDRQTFDQKLACYKPRVVCFNGKKAGMLYLGLKQVSYGRQSTHVDGPLLFVAPSTSAAARGYWDEQVWHDLAQLVKSL